MKEIVYIRMKKQLHATEGETIQLQDVTNISTRSANKEQIETTPVYTITKKDRNIIVIDSFIIIDHLNTLFNDIDFQLIGSTETIIRVEQSKSKSPIVIVAFVWLLLFIGAAMTIMNFHYDVNMQEVQQKLHYLLTGEENDYPLWIQIPYSLGLGIGMLLFFNHWFKKRFNEEPSPLEVELYNYQQDLDQYLIYYENHLNDD